MKLFHWALIVSLSISMGVGWYLVAHHQSIPPEAASVSSAEELINKTSEMMWNANPGAANNSSSPKLSSICSGKGFDCYENYYKGLVKNKSVEAALQDIKARYNQDSYVANMCHPLMHAIGNTAANKYPTVSQAYLHGNTFCYDGYYHGVLETIVARISKGELANQMNTICSDISDKKQYGINYYNCVHGLGHGVMAYTNDELFQALGLCDKLSGDWEKTSCYSGVFMENVIVDNKNHFTKYLKPKSDFLYPCDAVGNQYKTACYLIHTGYMLKYNSNDVTKVFSLCSKADVGYQSICYQSLGRDISGSSSSDPEKTKAYCLKGKGVEQQQNCIIGAVKDFIYRFHRLDEGMQLCNILSSDLQRVCTTTAQNFYKAF